MGQSIGSLFPLRLRLWLGRLLFQPIDTKAVRVSRHRLIKGPCLPPEVEAMQFVASHTTIPIPKIYAIHTEKNGAIYIEMAYVQGNTLSSAWKTLSTTERDTIVADIKRHIGSLRELPPPLEGVVSSALQNPAYDCRIGYRFYGPMELQEFHSLARGHLLMEEVAPYNGTEVAKVHTACYKICFTHADLAPRNIMVNGGRVVAIIDWAFAGWYPEYWEFTKAHYAHFMDKEWEEYLRCALAPYETELIAEQTLWERLPEPGTAGYSRSNDGTCMEHPGSSPSASWLDARVGRQLSDLWSFVET